MKDETKVIRSTLTAACAGMPLHAGPVFASPFHLAENPENAGYTYGRSHNPTWTELEAAIGGMEVEAGTPAAGVRVFASGMAAVAAIFGALLRPGDKVVLQAGGYFTARKLLLEWFGPMGVRVEQVRAGELTNAERLRGARVVYAETPSNPRLEVVDVSRLAEAAHHAGALLAVDNTTASPLGQRPLMLGADISVCSDSKSMGGHSDLILGHVAVRDEGLLGKIDGQRTLTGGIAGPMEAWLMMRSLATLPLRLRKSSANALALAEFLGGRAEVKEVLYPGLRSHPGHEIAARQMREFGPVLGVELKDRGAAERFLGASELVTEATSFGGIATTAERRMRWGGDDVGEGFLRLSAGCEDAGDLIEDVGRALEAAGG